MAGWSDRVAYSEGPEGSFAYRPGELIGRDLPTKTLEEGFRGLGIRAPGVKTSQVEASKAEAGDVVASELEASKDLTANDGFRWFELTKDNVAIDNVLGVIDD